MSSKVIFMNQNAYQNAAQASQGGFSNNLRYCNVENGFSTVQEFNTKIGSSLDMAKRLSQPQEEEEDEPLFGTHIRQAATTIRKIFAR